MKDLQKIIYGQKKVKIIPLNINAQKTKLMVIKNSVQPIKKVIIILLSWNYYY